MIQSSNLSKCIVSSSRLASIFDWRMSSRIMAIDVSKRLISLSVAGHPNYDQDDMDGRDRIYRTIEKIEPLPYMSSSVGHCKNFSRAMFNNRKEQVKKQIDDIVKEYGVVGFVVGWPLEKSGLPGANCGRVLHLLDFLADEKNGSVIRKNRPLTLWDQRVLTRHQFIEAKKPQDKWGRSAAFCHYPAKKDGGEESFYISNHGGDNASGDGSSEECAELLLKQFLDSHYKLDANDESYSRQRQISPPSYNILNTIQQYERDGACIASSLL